MLLVSFVAVSREEKKKLYIKNFLVLMQASHDDSYGVFGKSVFFWGVCFPPSPVYKNLLKFVYGSEVIL